MATITNPGAAAMDDGSALDDKLKAFNRYLDEKYPGQVANALRPPYIEHALFPITRADFGIDDEHPWDDDEKLTLVVQPYAGMQVGDVVKLVWDGMQVGIRSLVKGQIGKPLVFKVKAEKVPEGPAMLVVKVQRRPDRFKAYETLHTSVSLNVIAWFDRPGDENFAGGSEADGQAPAAITCKLDAPVVALPDEAVIGLEQAWQGVRVTIPAYRYMNACDIIRLCWGGQLVQRVVQEAQVGQDIAIEVDKAAIEAGGDGDGVQVWYDVVDEVGNASRDISAKALLKVHLGSAGLAAPEFIDPSTGKTVTSLVPSELGDRDLQVRISGQALQPGDKVTLTAVSLAGSSAQGGFKLVVPAPQTVSQGSSDLFFMVRNAQLRYLENGSLQAAYTVERDGKVQPGPPDAQLPVIGKPRKPDAPVVDDVTPDEDGQLQIDADLEAFYVIAPLKAGLEPGDIVYVTLRGMQANGQPWLGFSRDATAKDPPADLVFRFRGDEDLKPLEGGWLDISYTIERGSPVLERTSESVRVGVGEMLETLIAPGTEMSLEDGNLDPDRQAFKRGVYITIPEPADIKPPYSLRLFWDTDAGSHFESEQAVAPGMRPDVFRVPETELALGELELVDVTVYYMIYQDGKPDRASEDLEFTICREQADEDLEDYLDDDSQGSDEIDDLLRDFDAYLKQKNPNEAPGAVPRPYVFGAEHPVASADFGIGAQLIEDYDDQVLVLVRAWVPMNAGDTLKLFWGGRLVAFRKVKSGEDGTFMTLAVQAEDIPPGASSMYCQVQRKGGAQECSGSVSTWVALEPPGVQDGEGLGLALLAPAVALPALGVIGLYEAQRSVSVTIQPYLNMKAHDLVRLFWGAELIEYRVPASAVGKPIVIKVVEAIIAKAGDSNELPVYYDIVDEVGNESEWSDDAAVKVNLLQGKLGSPQVLDSAGVINWTGVINRGDLGPKPLQIQVKDANLAVADSITLTWVGVSNTGQETVTNLGPMAVAEVGQALRFSLPGERLEMLQRARIFFTLTRNGVSSKSGTKFIRVEGVAYRLPAPTLNGAEGDWIDADLTISGVRIAQTANLQIGDVVYIEVIGVRADGQRNVLPIIRKDISALVLKNPTFSVALKGGRYLKPFEGGYVEVSYRVVRGAQTLRSEADRWYVGYLQESLAAPFPEPALPNNTLDPTLPQYEFDMDIVVPEEVAQLAPCTITLYWTTSSNGYYEHDVDLEVGDDVPVFQVPHEFYQVDEGDVVEVEVYYVVDFVDKPSKASESLEFRIATNKAQVELLPEMQVPQAKDGKLELFDVPDSGLRLKVPVYPGMNVGDQIVIRFGDFQSKPYPVARVGIQDIDLAASVVFDHARGNTQLSYEVVPVAGGERLGSRPSELSFDGVGTLERFKNLTPGRRQTRVTLQTPLMSVRFIHSSLVVSSSNGAAWPQGVDRAVYASCKDANDRRPPAYELRLKEPARKVRLHLHGYGTVEVLDSNSKVISTHRFNARPRYLAVSSADRRIAAIKVTALRGPKGTYFLGVGEVLLVR